MVRLKHQEVVESGVEDSPKRSRAMGNASKTCRKVPIPPVKERN